MSADRKWQAFASEDEFTGFFAGRTIKEAQTTNPTGLPWVDADIYWVFSDGEILAMHVDTRCPTCGYGSGDKTYYRTVPA